MPLDFVGEELARLEREGLLRTTRTVEGAQGPRVVVDGREVVNFSSNNYLGLAGHERLRQAARSALEEAGVGAAASRLIAGTMREHEALEQEIAVQQGRPAALLFNSGFQANVGTIPALFGREDVIFSDALNHASLIDGCRLSRARTIVYPHRDAGALRRLLAEEGPRHRRRLILSESVFSMDGDRAPLRKLAALAREHDATLMLDEAHALGVLGPRGRGLAEEEGVEPEILVGTLGKAVGSFGAFVAGDAGLIQLLLNRARAFVFTTAPPPAIAAASRAALEILAGPEGEALRSELGARVHQLARGLQSLDLLAPDAGTTPVFPIHVGDDRGAMEATDRLLREGLYAQGIRPPTVPPGTARLRVSLMASHTREDVERLLGALRDLRRTGLLPSVGGCQEPAERST